MPKKKIKFIEIARRHECCLLYLLDILGVPFPKGSYGDHFRYTGSPISSQCSFLIPLIGVPVKERWN